MGRASRAKAERAATSVNGKIIRRGKRFYYRREIVGYELHPLESLPSIPNPPAEPLQPFELEEDL